MMFTKGEYPNQWEYPEGYGNNERGFQLRLVASARAHEVAHAPEYKIGEDLDAEGGVVEYGGVLAPVKQRLADQVVRDCPEPTLGPCCCLGSPPQVVVAAGQQVARISRAGQRRGMRAELVAKTTTRTDGTVLTPPRMRAMPWSSDS